MRGNTYTSHDSSPCKRLKDENGADSSKSQSVAELWELWPRPANLRRESCDWAQLRNFRSPYSSSVEIVKDLAGISIHLPNFSDLPTPPTYIHAPQKIPTQSTKSILGGPADRVEIERSCACRLARCLFQVRHCRGSVAMELCHKRCGGGGYVSAGRGAGHRRVIVL